MYTLHTTQAFVLQSYPHGESNRTYKLLTREKGMLYAHGQGVRELKSRNKFALQTGSLSEITLVRGREKWRITGARTLGDGYVLRSNYIHRKKMLELIGGLLPIEDGVSEVFDILIEGNDAFARYSEEEAPLVEIIVTVRLMDKLGFLAKKGSESGIEAFLGTCRISDGLLQCAHTSLSFLRKSVHNALNEAR